MSEWDRDGVSRLAAEVDRSSWPAPELLARYAAEPEALTPEETAIVEQAIAAHPAVRDEVETLQSFDFGALDTRTAEVVADNPRRGFRSPGWGLALAAGLAALAFWWVAGPATDPEPRIAETGPREEVAPGPVRPLESEYAEHRPESRRSDATRSPGAEASTELAERGVAEGADGPGVLPPAATPDPPEDRSGGSETLAEKTPSVPAAPPAPPPQVERPQPGEPREMLLAMATPVYRPAFGLEGLPQLGTVVRGGSDSAPTLNVVSPAHVTRVVSASPPLHWRVEAIPDDGFFMLTILDEEDNAVALDVALPRPGPPGLQTTDLAALDVRLPQNTLLRWSVAWRPEAGAPPRAFDFGWIRFAPLTAEEQGEFAAMPEVDRPAFLALRGGFHEALAAANAFAEAHPEASAARDAVTVLLEQVPAAVRPTLD